VIVTIQDCNLNRANKKCATTEDFQSQIPEMHKTKSS